jgi:hypothetical protein
MNILMTIVIIVAVVIVGFVGTKYWFGTSVETMPYQKSATEIAADYGANIGGGARKWFRGKKMSRGQSTGALLVVVSALIYSLYRSVQHFLFLRGM